MTRTADFTVAAVVPIAGAAADRDLAPVYPGITEAATPRRLGSAVSDRSRRVRRVDEEYWKRYRTTPKAFVPLEVGQRAVAFALRRSHVGASCAGRRPAAGRDARPLRRTAACDRSIRSQLGLSVRDVRGEGLAASRGATDFGEYFTYFSFFLVASALLLAALFFRLGVEQRRARGRPAARGRLLDRRASGGCSSPKGRARGRRQRLGVAGAVGYAGAMMTGFGRGGSARSGRRR